jgi:WXG100 family type VII secretion target
MSTGAAFNTELPTMDVASAHVFEVNESVQATLRDLLNRLDPLMSTWQGSAATSFHVLKDRWNDNATKLNDALRSIGDGLVQAETNYAVSDDTNNAGFTGITGNLA